MERAKIDKRKITNDWQKYCPGLSKLRMLDIDNRVGPLIIGFYLQVLGDGTIYMPLYKVENLYSHYSVLPSSLEIEGRTMDMQTHEIYSEQIAQQLIQKAYIPLQGVNVNIKMLKKWNIKMYIFPRAIPQPELP